VCDSVQLSPILALHICAGTLGLLSGTVAISVRKGSRNHATAGIVFSVSMLTLAATGVYIAYTKSQPGNILGGLLTLYMIATAWMAARRRDMRTGAFDLVALLAALAVGTACITYGFKAANGQTNDGVPAGMEFFLGFVILLAAAGDIRMLVRGGVSGTQRIARHLWRMCFGLFIASGSFFLGRQRIFPEFVRKSNVLIFLTIFPLMLLVFWLIRVRFTNLYKETPLLRTSKASSEPT
jgi:uncharacterized membrane protein